MALKNNSGLAKNVWLLRYATFVPWDQNSTLNQNENYDGTDESTFGWLSSTTPGHSAYFGLMLQNVGNAAPASALGSNVGFPVISLPDRPCNPFYWESRGTLVNTFGGGQYLYGLAIKAEQTVTVTDRYLSF
jgi:hypothetical protein